MLSITFTSAAQTQKVAYCDWSQLKVIKSLAFLDFIKDKITTNLILSIGTHAEKVATQMSKSCRPNGRWAALKDNPAVNNRLTVVQLGSIKVASSSLLPLVGLTDFMTLEKKLTC